MRVKYPKTPHLPWSPGFKNDDTLFKDWQSLFNKRVVVTEKMDGENTTMYDNGIHARSLDSRHHASRDYVKALHAQIKCHIPASWRICGENLYAQHSVMYDDLAGYFQIFNIWDDFNRAISWDDTVMFAEFLGLPTVPVLYRGEFLPDRIENAWKAIPRESEGYVVRVDTEFHADDFRKNVAKYVRKDHIQTDSHWMNQAVVPNQLAVPLRRV